MAEQFNEEEFRKKWNVKESGADSKESGAAGVPPTPAPVPASFLRRWLGGGNAAKAADTAGNKTGRALKELGQ